MNGIDTDLSKTAKDLANVAKDATYVVIGAGVLGFQQAQVRRQELLKRLNDPRTVLEQRLSTVRSDLSGALNTVDTRVDDAMDRVEEIIGLVEGTFAPLEERLPSPARDLAKAARSQAKQARHEIRNRIPSMSV